MQVKREVLDARFSKEQIDEMLQEGQITHYYGDVYLVENPQVKNRGTGGHDLWMRHAGYDCNPS